MVSAQLEESLRHEIESYIEGRLSGVRQEISELQSQLNESLTRLLDRQGEVQLDGSVAASILQHLRAAHQEGIDVAASESSRAKASSDMAIVKAAVAEIGEQSAQADVLKALVNRAASFAPRVAFFAIKSERAIGWRGRGFQGTVGDNTIQQISVPVSADSIIGEVARSRTTWSGGPHSHSEDHLILNRLGEEPPQRIVAIPLTVRNRTVAVLYTDSAALDSEAINLEALETLVKVSGMAVELLAGQAPAKQPAPEPAPAAEAPAPETSAPDYVLEGEYGEPAPAATFEEAAPQPFEVGAEPYVSEAPQATKEPPAQHETHAQFDQFTSTPQPPPPTAVAESAAPRRRYATDVELPVEVEGEEEKRLHIDAQRFARLLVSEINLYNEQNVADGREQNDLYERLREYIDRSREMYDKRVKPEVAQKFDYFHHELVTTLAVGDVAKLGTAYPGATVSA
ncbi:MAG: hypothetical protein H0T64_07620 [Pyrinomonadaceae bacterium]|nr:hypothetical protein [Pyrinomonadaceae bacterium]MBA3568287.1 hypothetical protein [Pyrinomonadaceae bacterium]